MKHRFRLLLLVVIFFAACDVVEFRGLVTSYEDVEERFKQSELWNRQNGFRQIEVDQSAYQLHVMGDSHVGGTENLVRLLYQSKQEEVVAVVMVGDITTGNKEDYDVLLEHIPDSDSLLTFAVVGNHDLYFDGWKQFYTIFGSSSYFFVVNTPQSSDIYFCLDSGGGTLGSLQYEWFTNLLETTRHNYRFCVVFTHDNLIRFRSTTSTNPMAEEVQALLDVFLRYNVTMVVNAHDHKRNSDKFGNTTFVVMDALQDENNAASYLNILVSDDQLSYGFVDLP